MMRRKRDRMGVLRRLVPMLLLLVGVCADAARAGEDILRIEMRSTARVAVGDPVTVGDIAQVTGDGAQEAAGVVLIERAEAGDGWTEISVQQVRDALKAHGVRESALSLRGSSCGVLALGPWIRAETTTVKSEPVAKPARAEGTVREEVERVLSEAFGVPARDLRIVYDRRAIAFVDQARSGRSVLARVTGLGDRPSVRVRIFEGERTIDEQTVRCEVRIRRRVLVAGRDIQRGETLDPSRVRVLDQWLRPTTRPAPIEGFSGQVAARSIREGRVIEEHAIEAPILIKRGDLCTLSCVSGTILIEIQQVRARGDGREGDIIEFETRDRRRIRARVDGPLRAIIVAGGGS